MTHEQMAATLVIAGWVGTREIPEVSYEDYLDNLGAIAFMPWEFWHPALRLNVYFLDTGQPDHIAADLINLGTFYELCAIVDMPEEVVARAFDMCMAVSTSAP
jgi:hypothetical protein